jgi:hypothetical protein
MKKSIIAATVALMIAPTALAGSAFIRFEMIEYKNDEAPTEVKMRIPLSLFSALSGQINEAISEVELENEDFDLRAIWAEVRAAGPNEYVTVNSEDARIRIATTETHVEIQATDEEGHVTPRPCWTPWPPSPIRTC